jgi:hypothetical protein
MPWVLPHEAGRVDNDALRAIWEMVAEHPRSLLIAGYSESDEEVVQRLITPLDHRWPLIRVGPRASGPDALTASAEAVLPMLAKDLTGDEDAFPWEHVTFQAQRDLGAALRGVRLGPGDVEACPRLPEVAETIAALKAASTVALLGDSGSGKSITAYQVLADCVATGREAIRLRSAACGEPVQRLVDALSSLPRPVVAIVDDAQSIPPDTLRRLIESATPTRNVLIVSTDDVSGPAVVVRIAEGRAVAALAQSLRRDAAAMLPLVAALDDRVGSRPFDERLEWRIDAAARERTPWQFIFAVTGGWRRAQGTLDRMRDQNRADLALLAVAVGQIASADAGVSRAWLSRSAALLGRGDDWLDQALVSLVRERLVAAEDHILRYAHLRLAWVVVTSLLHPPHWPTQLAKRIEIPPITGVPASVIPLNTHRQSDLERPSLPQGEQDADRRAVAELMTAVLDDAATDLRGLLWLLGRNHDLETRWVLAQEGVTGSARLHRLADRALATPAGPQSGTAAALLADLRQWDQTIDEAITAAEGQLMSLVK